MLCGGVCVLCKRLPTAPHLPAFAFERSLPPKPVLPGLLATAMPRMPALCSEAVACDRPCRQASSTARLLSIAHEALESLLWARLLSRQACTTSMRVMVAACM